MILLNANCVRYGAKRLSTFLISTPIHILKSIAQRESIAWTQMQNVLSEFKTLSTLNSVVIAEETLKTTDVEILHRCLDCGQDTRKMGEYYSLKDRVWACIHPTLNGMLCIGCAEKRLGRNLTPADFKLCPLNDPSTGNKSERLISRIRGANARKHHT